MTKTFTLIFIAAFLLVASKGIAQQITLSKEVQSALNEVDTTQIRADIAYLADDKLLGRAPGPPGYQRAVDYVIKRLKSLNVKPAGENGTWLQNVRFRKAFIKGAELSLTGPGSQDIKTIGGYALQPNPSLPDVKISAGLAF